MATVKMVKQFTRDEIKEMDPEEVTRLFDAGALNEALGRPIPKATDETPSDLIEEVDEAELDADGKKKAKDGAEDDKGLGDRKVQGVNA